MDGWHVGDRQRRRPRGSVGATPLRAPPRRAGGSTSRPRPLGHAPELAAGAWALSHARPLARSLTGQRPAGDRSRRPPTRPSFQGAARARLGRAGRAPTARALPPPLGGLLRRGGGSGTPHSSLVVRARAGLRTAPPPRPRSAAADSRHGAGQPPPTHQPSRRSASLPPLPASTRPSLSTPPLVTLTRRYWWWRSARRAVKRAQSLRRSFSGQGEGGVVTTARAAATVVAPGFDGPVRHLAHTTPPVSNHEVCPIQQSPWWVGPCGRALNDGRKTGTFWRVTCAARPPPTLHARPPHVQGSLHMPYQGGGGRARRRGQSSTPTENSRGRSCGRRWFARDPRRKGQVFWVGRQGESPTCILMRCRATSRQGASLQRGNRPSPR